MAPDRRSFLIRSTSGLAVAAAGTGCASTGTTGPVQKVALLAPMSGEFVALGAEMAAAARAGLERSPGLELEVFDTGSDDQSAQRAAREARLQRVVLVLGPVFGPQVGPVLREINATSPVLTFSNDESLARVSEASLEMPLQERTETVGKAPVGTHTRRLRSNRDGTVIAAAPIRAGLPDVWVLGVTARQSTRAIIRYARRQGARRLVVVGGTSAWGRFVEAAAAELAGASDIEAWIAETGEGGLTASSLLQAQEGMEPPHAVLFADLSAASIALASDVRKMSFPALFAAPGAGLPADAAAGLEGAWFASPVDGTGQIPTDARAIIRRATNSLLASLAYDGAFVASAVIASPETLIRRAAFEGALGEFSFRQNRQLDREMAIITLRNGRLVPVARVPGTA